jgi:hypothetical protein
LLLLEEGRGKGGRESVCRRVILSKTNKTKQQ